MSRKPQSPFADKLATNYAPSDSEIQEINSFLKGPLAELAVLEAQIEETQAVLDRLSAQREALTGEINAHRALLSPMRHLPQEILQEIFIACLPTTHNALMHPDYAPLLLGLVCRHWRSVAHSTPRLWSSLHIASLSDVNEPERPMAALMPLTSALAGVIDAWLERSRTCPLSISFGNPSQFTSPSDSSLLSELQKAAHRIRHLDLFSPSDIFEEVSWLNANAGEGLTPEVVLISTPLIHIDDPELWATVKLLRSPNIRRVLLQIGADALTLPLPWPQLTDLALSCYVRAVGNGAHGGLDYTGALEVLRRCPNLVRCQLEITAETPFAPPSSAITLPHLKAFILSFSYGGLKELAPVMQCLVLPVICYLSVGEAIFDSVFNSPVADTAGFTVGIPPNLFPQAEVLHFLEILPRISHLYLTPPNTTKYYNFTVDTRLDDDFLAALTPTPTRSPVCPDLTHIYIFTRSPAFSHRSIVPFISGRMGSGRPLKVVNIQFANRSMEEDVSPALQEFVDVGLQITIAYPSPPTPSTYNPWNGLSD
ncbi:hypothetical protein C8R46DRAFT_363679 [Mycena filopes]|nr:hypothetical protein C8R46DRAFT_363679 [Mycena filopes]